MFRIHKEGYGILIAASIIILLVNLFFYKLTPSVFPWFAVASLVLLGVILQFFRNPRRAVKIYDNKMVYAPADGKVVVIEQVVENEYFKDKRIQISIFMSPFNVHVNRNPIGGIVSYYRYHRGKYLVAWHPKSSTENERTTVVIAQDKSEILFRQIAGAMAKRIVAYVREGQMVTQGADMGFIKFGSRVDIFLPLDAKILVKKEETVKGNTTVLAQLA